MEYKLVKNATMKRILFILLATLSTAVCSAGTDAMSNSKVRKETRFLTDKMAYELNLNTEQYNDVYEINYDFISGIRYLMDDVLYGNEWALNRYYDYLDVRNDDLRWVLSSRQYARFISTAPSIPVETVGTSVFTSRIPITIISISPGHIITVPMQVGTIVHIIIIQAIIVDVTNIRSITVRTASVILNPILRTAVRISVL